MKSDYGSKLSEEIRHSYNKMQAFNTALLVGISFVFLTNWAVLAEHPSAPSAPTVTQQLEADV